jgi:DNA-binding transcriptional ArsR family regulator
MARKNMNLSARTAGLRLPIHRYPLITPLEAEALMRLFKVFANDTRLRLLHALVREGELCVTDLAEAIAIRPQAVSNQLQRLVDRGILSARRNGSNIYYRVVDPCVPVLLERGLCLIACHPESNAMSAKAPSRRRKRGR